MQHEIGRRAHAERAEARTHAALCRRKPSPSQVACAAVGQRLRSGSPGRCSISASRMTSCISRLSLVLAPSVPSATVTPARSILATGEMPVPSLRLLSGLCTGMASRSANSCDVVIVQPDRVRGRQALGSAPRACRVARPWCARSCLCAILRLDRGFKQMHVDRGVVAPGDIDNRRQQRVAAAHGVGRRRADSDAAAGRVVMAGDGGFHQRHALFKRRRDERILDCKVRPDSRPAARYRNRPRRRCAARPAHAIPAVR